MSFKTTTNLTQKGNPTSTTSIPVNVLTNFTLETDLTSASNNNGKNTLTKKGMIIGKRYSFLPKCSKQKFTDKVIWIIEYTSPSTSTIMMKPDKKRGISVNNKSRLVTIKRTTLAGKVVLDLSHEHYLDMAGCELTITCYLKNTPGKKVIKKYFVHNRFCFFDAKTVLEQAKSRMKDCWKIDQAQSSLCGMACLYYILIQRNKNLYKKIAVELHRTGIYKFNNGYTIEPDDSMYKMKTTNKNYKNMAMDEVDWIVLASTRSSESRSDSNDGIKPLLNKASGIGIGYIGGTIAKKRLIYKGIENGSLDELGAVNWMDMLIRMCKQVAGYGTVIGHDLDYFDVAKTIATKQIFSLNKLLEIDKKYNAGKKIMMMIQPTMLYGKRGNRNINSIHWIVYEGNLQFYNGDNKKVSQNSLHIGKISFDMFTWGEDPKAHKREISSKRNPISAFSTNYYGYIEVN